MYARIYARMYARAYECGQIVIRTHDKDRHTTSTPTEHTTTGKERNAGNTGKPAYIGIIAGNEKKYKKSQKKFGNTKKGCNFVSVIKNQTTMKQIVTDNTELFEVLTANGINIICNDEMQMMITDTDATRIDAIVAEKAPAAFADYVIC